MKPGSVRDELCDLLPVWLAAVLLPAPVILFWHSTQGRSMALGCFFVGCTTLVAYSFRREIPLPQRGTKDHKKVFAPLRAFLWPSRNKSLLPAPSSDWSERMKVLIAALLAAFAVFSALCLAFNNPPESESQAIWWRSSLFAAPRDLIATLLALWALVPSLCLAPYLTLVTRSRLAAVVFTVFLVFCMKLLGCVVVVLVYGWNAAENGHTAMPWHHPDLLVWLFWGFTLALSLSFYFLGAKRFRLVTNSIHELS